MAQGKKLSPADIKKVQKTALKHTTVDADGNIDVNKAATAAECGFNEHAVKEHTENDPQFSELLAASIKASKKEVQDYLPKIGKLIGKKAQFFLDNEEMTPNADIRGIAGASSDYIKQLQLLSGNPTEVVGGQIEVKKFDEW